MRVGEIRVEIEGKSDTEEVGYISYDKNKTEQEVLEKIITKIELWQNSNSLKTIERVHNTQYLYGFMEGLRLSKAIVNEHKPQTTEEGEG